MLKSYDEVKLLKDLKVYANERVKYFVRHYYDDIAKHIKERFKKSVQVLSFKYNNVDVAARRCPNCGEISLTVYTGPSYGVHNILIEGFECEHCSFDTRPDGDDYDGFLGFRTAVLNSMLPENSKHFISYTQDYVLSVVSDYIPSEFLLINDLELSLKLSDEDGEIESAIDALVQTEDIDNSSDLIAKVFELINEADITFEDNLNSYLGKEEIVISERFGYRFRYDDYSNFKLFDNAVSKDFSFGLYTKRKDVLNLFKIDESDIDSIVSDLEYKEETFFEIQSRRLKEIEKASVLIRNVLENIYTPSINYFSMSFDKIRFKDARNSKRSSKSNSVSVNDIKKLLIKEQPKVFNEVIEKYVDKYYNSELNKTRDLNFLEALKGNGMLVNVSAKDQEAYNIQNYDIEYFCLDCNTFHSTNYLDEKFSGVDTDSGVSLEFYPTTDFIELNCDNCENSAVFMYHTINNLQYELSAAVPYDEDDIFVIVNRGYDNKYSTFESIKVLSVNDLGNDRYMSTRWSFDLQFVANKEDIKSLVKGDIDIKDCIYLKPSHSIEISLYDESKKNIVYYKGSGVIRDSELFYSLRKVNYSEISGLDFEPIEDNLLFRRIDYVYDKDLIAEISDKIKVNKYNAYDYFVQNIVGLEENDDMYYAYFHFFPKGYISMININSSYELIMKDPRFSGLFKEVFDKIDTSLTKKELETFLDKRATKPTKALGIDNKDVNILSQVVEEEGLDYIRASTVFVYKNYQSLIKKVYKELGVLDKFNSDLYSFNTFYSIYRVVDSYTSEYSSDLDYESGKLYIDRMFNDLVDICRILEITPFQALEYGDSLYYNQGILLNQGLSIWSDYLGLAISIGYNLDDREVSYPDSLKREHDVAVMVYNKLRKGEKEIEFKLTNKVYERLEDRREDLDYIFVLPETSKDLVSEGSGLRHCVGSYIDDVAKNKRAIIFMRKSDEPDVPFITIEIRGNSVVQARGFGNKEIGLFDDDVYEAFENWAKEKSLNIIL